MVVIDIKLSGLLRRPEVVTLNATKRSGLEPADFAQKAQDLGAGEIVINSVDRDGKMTGYDLNMLARIKRSVNIPITVLGGAGSLDDIRKLLEHYPVIGAAAGSIFVFKGKYRAVLINYPNHAVRDDLSQHPL